ncbi:MAG: DUF6569 family protein [Planctomycetaceae bacterium]|nr:hypothetical protein [Planctomycetaceae bacterium]
MENERTEQNGVLKTVVPALRIGEAFGHRNLTLVPLRGEGYQGLDYTLAQDAIAAGVLAVTEVSEAGSVPELLANNTGVKMVLLLDGEELVGAKQNRIMNTSVLLKGESKTKIPVSCVEQGRWYHESAKFQSGNYSPSRLRARKSRDVTASLRESGQARSDQGAVWQEVRENVMAFQAASPTMAMSDVVKQRRESFDLYVQALTYPEGACGVVAAVNGRFLAADIFDKPQTLERVWQRLITGYAMDAAAQLGERNKDFSAKAASVLMEHVGGIDCTICPSVGVGGDWRFAADDVVGQALVADQTCVHLCVFPGDDVANRRGLTQKAIQAPSRRRTRRQQ